MLAIVTTMNTAKAANTTTTIIDWALATNFAPTRLIASIPRINTVMNRLFHPPLAC
jgi:hypothetical protein